MSKALDLPALQTDALTTRPTRLSMSKALDLPALQTDALTTRPTRRLMSKALERLGLERHGSITGPPRPADERLGPYAPQGSTSLLPELSVTWKVSAPTSHTWVGSGVHFRSSEDETLLEFTSPVDCEYMRQRRKFH